jgi:hypothetical protein
LERTTGATAEAREGWRSTPAELSNQSVSGRCADIAADAKQLRRMHLVAMAKIERSADEKRFEIRHQLLGLLGEELIEVRGERVQR